MKKILITGAAGFVGSNIIPILVQNGYKVTALVKNDNERAKLKNMPVNIVVGDLSEIGPWQNSLKGNTVIIHLAAEISSKDPQTFVKNNVTATQNLIDAARKHGSKRIIHFSTAAVGSIREDPYSKTKKEQEVRVTKSGIEYFVLRPSMMYGPGDDKNVGWLIKTLKRMPITPLPGGGQFGRQPVYIGDICKIVLRLMEVPRGNKIYEIHGYEYITLRQMVAIIKKEFKIMRPTISIPVNIFKLVIIANQHLFPNPKFTADQIESLVSGERFKGDDWAKLFDIIPTSFSQGVKKMV
jgi:nucleoside-diphosphate-sugar epimerase